MKNNNLIPEKEWVEVVDSLKGDGGLRGKEELKKKLTKAIKKRIPDKKFGIFFSGGVDSSLIAAVCKKLGVDFICYTVGFQDGGKEPDDVVEAKKVAS